jgi:hypothetical protein
MSFAAGVTFHGDVKPLEAEPHTVQRDWGRRTDHTLEMMTCVSS